MSLLGNFFARSPDQVAQDLNRYCLMICREHFLEKIRHRHSLSQNELLRFDFNRDVFLLLLASFSIQTFAEASGRSPALASQATAHLRKHFFMGVPLPPKLIVGKLIECPDELSRIKVLLGAGESLAEMRTVEVDTPQFLSVVTEIRSDEFLTSFVSGAMKSKVGADVWLDSARTFLWRIQGGDRDAIPFDEVNRCGLECLTYFPYFGARYAELNKR